MKTMRWLYTTGARIPTRPTGTPPILIVDVSIPQTNVPHLKSVPVPLSPKVPPPFTTHEARTKVASTITRWCFGNCLVQEEEDYRFLNRDHSEIRINQTESVVEVEISVHVLIALGITVFESQPLYMAGRSSVAWETITVPQSCHLIIKHRFF